MPRSFNAHRPMTEVKAFEPSWAVRDLDSVVSPTIQHCRTASAVIRQLNDPFREMGHDATRRAAF